MLRNKLETSWQFADTFGYSLVERNTIILTCNRFKKERDTNIVFRSFLSDVVLILDTSG